MKKTKQMLAMLLSLSLCLSAIPMPASAADNEPTATSGQSVAETTEVTTEFYDPTGHCEEFPTSVCDTTDPSEITGLVTVCEEYDTSPMYIGEERIIRFWNPETLTAGDAQITDSHTIRWFECSYDEELGAMRIKATSPGVTTFYCLAEGCDHPVRIELCAVEPETTIAASGVTCTETLDWAPTATYEKNHLDVGEEMTVQFSVNHPVSGARISSDPTDVVSISDFDDSHFVVTGLKDGKVNLTLSFPECPVVYHIFLTVGEVQPTTEFYDPTGHCVETDLYEPTSEIPPTDVHHDPVEPTTEIETQMETIPETHMETHIDAAPSLTYERDTLAAGESMTIRYVNPIDGSTDGVSISVNYKDIVSVTETGDGWFTVTAKKPGKVNISVSMPGCTLIGHAFLTVEGNASDTEIPPTDVYHDPTEPTTEFYDPTGHCEEFPTSVCDTTDPSEITGLVTVCEEYDTSPMYIGEERVIRFWNPETMTAGDAQITDSHTVRWFDCSYDKELGAMRIKALSPGVTTFYCLAEGCDHPVRIELCAEETEITEFYDPTAHCLETDPSEPVTEIPPTDVYHDPVEPTTEYYDPTDSCIETYTETIPDAAPTLEYERSVLAVGEYLTIRYKNPINGSTKDASVNINFDDVAAVVETGDGWLVVKAANPGEFNISISMPGCSLIGHAILTVEEADKLLDVNLGKLDDDDQVNAKDGTLILKDAAYFGTHGTHDLTEAQQKNADVNKDGLINAADATCVLIYAANAGVEKYPQLFPRFMENRKVLRVKETQDYTSIDPDPIRNVIAEDKPIIFAADDYEAFCSILRDYIGDALIHDTDQKTHKLSELTTKYDAAWFQDNSLICAAIKDPSYGIRYTNKGITGDSENGFTLHLTRDAYYAADMIETHFLFIEISKTYSASDLIRVFDVDVENVTTKPENHFFGYATERVQYTNKADAISLYTSAEAYAAFPYDFPSELSDDAEKFFADYNLLVLERTVGSGSYRFKVEGIDVADGICTVNLVKTSPEVITADMASWVIFIAVDKTITNAETITVNQTIQYI